MLNQISNIAREAGRIILDCHDAAVHQKAGHYNYVTDADVAVRTFLKKELLSLMPKARFYSEEQENEPLTDALTFVVDPIDGTTNFMRGRKVSAVSIGVLENNRPVAGVVFNPYENELFTAEAGKGAHCNGQSISVSGIPFENALAAIGTAPYDPNLVLKTTQAAAQFLLKAGDIRRIGSAALDLCDVACGRAEFFLELQLQPWDVAAGSLIVTEAGGRFHSLGHEQPCYEEPCGVLATNPLCDAPVQAILAEIL